ncbi:MAG: ABC transporter substrate-binding protein [Candidatus Thermoplasmatota archaeon]|nr:ABC transporter substrate-binding protein [Candidatus Thermoplasmatota archaeon]
MHSTRRILVLLMTTLMLSTTLVGCLGGDEKETTTDSTPSEPTTIHQDPDGDGVYGLLDQCPDIPGPLDSNNGTGCPAIEIILDEDNDGVLDEDDNCPSTSSAESVDSNGCSTTQLDSDGDGVYDAADSCPGTLGGTQVDESGCEVILDGDGDGVIDDDDLCDDTPSGTEVDADGCPVSQDSDNDGVLNDDDDCPNTLEGIQVDENGCEIVIGETTEVKIGLLTPRTGSDSALAPGLENATQMAIDEINAAQSAFHFTLVFKDTASNPNNAHMATWGLVESESAGGDGVSGILGGSSLSMIQSGIAKPKEFEIPIITSMVTSAGLDELEDDGLVWRTVASEADGAHSAAMWSNIYEMTNVAIVHIDDGFGRGYARTYEEAYGPENICLTVSYPPNTLDFSDQVQSIIQAGCDNIMIATYASDGAMLIDDIREGGLLDGTNPARIATAHHLGFPEFPEMLEDRTGVLGMVGATPGSWTSPLYADFSTNYQAAFGEEPAEHSASAYDAAMIMVRSVIQAGTITGADINAEIPNVGTMYDGVSGTIDFDDNGNTPGMNYDLFRFGVTGGGDSAETQFEEIGTWSQWNGIASSCRDDATPTVIGMLSPQTGIHSAYAVGEENGVKLGVELLNINLRSRCFSLTIADTLSTQEGAATAMQALVDSGVIGVIGPHSTEEALGAVPIADSSEIPIVNYGTFSDAALDLAWENADPNRMDGEFPDPLYGYFWRVSVSADHHATAIAAHLSNAGYSNVAVLHHEGLDSTAIADALDVACSSCTSRSDFTSGQSDFSNEVSALSGHDAVVILAQSVEGALILAEIHSQSLDIAMVGGHGMGDPSLLTAVTDTNHLTNLTGIRMGIDHDVAEYDHELKYVYGMNYGGAVPAYSSWSGDATLLLGTAAGLADAAGDVTGPRINIVMPTAGDEYAVSSGEITLDDETGDTNHTNLDVYHWSADGTFTEIGRWRVDLGLSMF